MTKTKQILITTASIASLLAAAPSLAQEKEDFKIAWTIYAGWMPWGYIKDSGIMDKWADAYDINVEIVQINDYIESINQYTAGAFDGVSATSMDTLSIPAGSGIDSTALIIGDYSNGNDALIVKEGITLEKLAGEKVNLVELSVSHYLLARALDSVGMSEADLGGVVNTSDADLIAAFESSDVSAVSTWNPLVSTILENPKAINIYNSSMIPGEILDLLVVNTDVLENNPNFGKALTGAWYEAMAIMSADTPEGQSAREAMGIASGTDLEGYEAQLAATHMFYDPAEAVSFASSENLPKIMTGVAEFLFDKGILGQGAPSADFVGISYPNGKITGDANNIKLRFDTTYMSMAEAGEL